MKRLIPSAFYPLFSDLKVGSRERGMGNSTFIYGYEICSSGLPSAVCLLPSVFCPVPSALFLSQLVGWKNHHEVRSLPEKRKK